MLQGAAGGKLLEQAAASDPPDADIWLWLSGWRAGRRDLRGALAAHTRAVALAPTRHRIVSSYTQLAWLLGRDDLADAAIDRFAIVAADQFAVGAMQVNRLERRGQLGAAAEQAVPLIKDGPRDPSRVLLTLTWLARATGDLAAVKALTTLHPVGKAYAAIYDPSGAEARAGERPDAFLDNVFADAESRSLVAQGKGRLLLDLAARHPARFEDDPAGTCCHDLGVNMILAMRQAGRATEADALLTRIERDTAASARAGQNDWNLSLQRMTLACLRGDAEAGRWLDRAIDQGWRGQAIPFAADPADEPACAAQAKQPDFAAARARLLALVTAEKPRVKASVAAAVAYLQKNPPVTPPADAR